MDKIKSREFKIYVTPKAKDGTNGVLTRVLHNDRKINDKEQFSNTIQNMRGTTCPHCKWLLKMFDKYGLPKE